MIAPPLLFIISIPSLERSRFKKREQTLPTGSSKHQEAILKVEDGVENSLQGHHHPPWLRRYRLRVLRYFPLCSPMSFRELLFSHVLPWFVVLDGPQGMRRTGKQMDRFPSCCCCCARLGRGFRVQDLILKEGFAAYSTIEASTRKRASPRWRNMGCRCCLPRTRASNRSSPAWHPSWQVNP